MKSARMIRIISFSIVTLVVLFGTASCNEESIYDGKPVLTLSKTASPASFSKAGDVITYTYEIKAIGPNFSGNYKNQIPITGLSISDSPLDGPVICPQDTLTAPNTMICTGTYTITDQDVANGSVTNSASVSGSFFLNDSCFWGNTGLTHNAQASAPPVTVTLSPDQPVIPPPVQARPSLTLVKSAEPTSFSKASKLIKFTFTFTNTGDVSIEGNPFMTGSLC